MAMKVSKVQDAIEDYRRKAVREEFHRMAGRGDKTAQTQYVNCRIAEGLELQAGDVLLDIGCGDGCLLRKAEGNVARIIGVLPTSEERARLQAVLPAADIQLGIAQKLPIPSETATKIVCNSVFILLSSKDAARDALLEIARVAKSGAKIWVGEIPELDEAEALGMYRGDSIPGLLWFLLRRQGLRAFLGMCRRVVLSWLGLYEIVLYPYGLFHAPPDEFIAMARECGLRLVRCLRHQEGCGENGAPIFSHFRYDYVFTKGS